MAIQVFLNATVLLDGLQADGDLNELNLEYGAETRDKTVLGMTTRQSIGGLRTVRVSMKGFVKLDLDGIHDQTWERVGDDGTVISVFPANPTEGDDVATAGWGFKTVYASYVQTLTEGDLYSFDLVAEGEFL